MSRTHRLTATLAAVVALVAILALPGTAAARDRNHDRIPDRWEKRHRLSLRVNQARRDQDRDRLRNRAEFLAGTNPRDADSDDDGIRDGEEHAGTIASFDPETGMLTIGLFGGGTIGGLVTEETEIECDDDGGEASASSGSSGDDEGEEAESGEDESGDDDETGVECTTADLVPGATVDEAELELENGVAVFETVELSD
jgi:hypothetical protein